MIPKYKPVNVSCVYSINPISKGIVQWLTFAMVLLLSTGSVGAQTSLDLEYAINLALDQNRSILRSSNRLLLAKNSILGEQSDFKIKIAPDANIGIQDGDDSTRYGFRLDRRFVNGTEVTTRVTNQDFGSVYGRLNQLTLELRQPLLANAGRLVNQEPIVRAEQNSLNSRRAHELSRIDLILQVVSLYYELIRLQRQVHADDKALKRLASLLKASRAKESLGWTTRVDSLRVELQLSEAQSRLNSNHDQEASARRQFSELLALPDDEQFKLSQPKPIRFEFAELGSAIATALSSRLEFAQVLQDSQDAERGVKIAKRRLKPAVEFVARYVRAEDSVFFNSGLAANDSWFVGLSADTDIFRRRQKVAYQSALLEETSAVQAIDMKRHEITREVRDSIMRYQLNQRNYKLAERSLGYARSRLELAQRLFSIGRESQFSVSDAEQAFLLAEIRFLTSEAMISVSGYRALAALGTLIDSPSELTPNSYGY